MAAGIPLRAAEPSWWARQGVKNTNAANDHAVATVGQAMHVAACARQEFDAAFSVIGGAGKTINELIANYYTVRNFNAIRIGQLKYIASLYWNRLGELGIYPLLPNGRPAYPWTPATGDDNDNALATLGQLKTVFSFVTDADSDSDGLPDWWEKEFFPGVPLASVPPAGNDDNDQLTNTMEWAGGGNPRVSEKSTADGKPKNILVGAQRRGVSSYKRWTAQQKAETPQFQARHALREAALMGDGNVVSAGQTGPAPAPGTPLRVKIPTKPGLIYQLEKLNTLSFAPSTNPPQYFTGPLAYAGNGQNLIFTVKDGPAGSDPGKIVNIAGTGSNSVFSVKKNFAGQTGLNLLSMFSTGNGDPAYGVIQALSWNPALAALTDPGAYGILPPGSGPAGRTAWGPASAAKWRHINPLNHDTHAPPFFHWPADGFRPFWVLELENSLAQTNLFTKWFTYPEILDSSDPDIQGQWPPPGAACPPAP
ncbi:MAG: hypothetical protein EOP86_23945 [Verrucomicrobiaceae bacterium]|nr:MAG: hypothetical protein EOP86_23945 [Verrucomicrobiaceae bacterium]